MFEKTVEKYHRNQHLPTRDRKYRHNQKISSQKIKMQPTDKYSGIEPSDDIVDSDDIFTKLTLDQHTYDANQLPFTVRINRDAPHECEFIMRMSWDFAQQLNDLLAPFMVSLAKKVEKRSADEKERLHLLQSMQDERRRMTILTLKALRLARKQRIPIERIADHFSLQHNLDPKGLLTIAYILKKKRLDRLHRFRNRKIHKLHQTGYGKKLIAREFNISVFVLNGILKQKCV